VRPAAPAGVGLGLPCLCCCIVAAVAACVLASRSHKKAAQQPGQQIPASPLFVEPPAQAEYYNR